MRPKHEPSAMALTIARHPIAFAVLLTLLVQLPLGCASYTSPPLGRSGLPSSELERRLAAIAALQARVEVRAIRGVDQAWQPGLAADALRRTGLFARVSIRWVDPGGEAAQPEPPADLVIRHTQRCRIRDDLPMATLLSLGLIPHVSSGDLGHYFMWRSAVQGEYTPLPVHYRGSTHLGWISILSGLWPTRTWIDPEGAASFSSLLREHLALHADELRAMVRGPF